MKGGGDGEGSHNELEWPDLAAPNDEQDFLKTKFSLNGNNVELDLSCRPNRSVLVERSAKPIDWVNWTTPDNDGVSRNPASPSQILAAPINGAHESFWL